MPWLRVVLLCVLVPPALSGCFHPVRMCCRGRNNTCKAVDDGVGHLRGRGGIPRPTVDVKSESVGQLVRAINEADRVYNEYTHENAGMHGDSGKGTSSLKTYIFGMPIRDPPSPEVKEYQPKPRRHLMIRYEIVAEHLPLTVLTSNQVEYDTGVKLMYLEAPPMDCYCDEGCVQLGDCCSDYTFVCPRHDCSVGEWGRWESCRTEGRRCGMGVQQRTRQVLQHPDRGGSQCPPLKEMRTCWVGCEGRGDSYEDMTTVALMLDYNYNGTRSRHSRRHRWMHTRGNLTMYYCVEYRLTWVNRNCIGPEFTSKLYKGNTICAECQPEAQAHRRSLRCASDLNDGEFGFWKLIGPKSCNGLWIRSHRTDHCKCSRDRPDMDRYLLA